MSYNTFLEKFEKVFFSISNSGLRGYFGYKRLHRLHRKFSPKIEFSGRHMIRVMQLHQLQ